MRALTPADDSAVRRLFRETVLLGAPLPFGDRDLARYEQLSLGWYLGPGRRDAAVLVDDDGTVRGYVLVCTRPDHYHRWIRRETAAFLGAVFPRLVARRYPEPVRHFYRLRLRDGWLLWRNRSKGEPMPVHAHLNLERSVRAARGGRLLVAHVDQVCRAARQAGWYGEMNAPVGKRKAALERLGGRCVAVVPNHTLSWLAGTAVERLTVVRELAEAA